MSNAAVFLVIFALTAVFVALTDRIRFCARHGLLTGVALVAIALVAIAVRTYFVTRDLCRSMLMLEVNRIVTDIDDQLGFGMLCGANLITDQLDGATNLTRETMIETSRRFAIDEINVVDSKGIVVASNTNQTGVAFATLSARNERIEARNKAYADLLAGRCNSVKDRFRDVLDEPEESVKYIAVRTKAGGFVQLGYRWSSFGRDFRTFFSHTFEDRKIGDTGFFLALDGQGRVTSDVASHPEAKGKNLTEIGLEATDLDRASDTQFIRRVFGRWCLCDTYERIGNWKGFAILPLVDVVYPAASSALFSAIILVIFCVIFRLLLVRLRRAQDKIDALRTAEEDRRAADMALARSIQLAELRTDGTSGEGYRIASLMHAAREVGGDFYDYYELADGRLAVTVADVSGKGVPAAFFMMKARTTLKSAVFSCATLAEAVAQTNVRLAGNNAAEMFVTAWVGVYDRRTGTLDYVSAGHNPPLVRRADGGVAWLEAPRAAALGVFEAARYRGAQVALAPGDRLFLYTDGVTEAMDRAGELFGNERLETTLKNAEGPLVPVVLKALEAFVSGAEQSDDITMLELTVERKDEEK